MITGSSALRIKLLFAAVILWQPIQYAFVSRFGDAYPLLQLPTFRGTISDDAGNIRLDTVEVEVIFDDNSKVRLSSHTLLVGVPSAFRESIMRHMFGPVISAPAPAGNSRWERTKLIVLPGLAASRARESNPEVDPETKQWLQRRLRELYPSRQPMTVDFVWRTDIYPVAGPRTVTHQPVGVREVKLLELR